MKRHRTYIAINLDGVVMRVSNSQMVRYLEHIIADKPTELYGEVIGEIDFNLNGLSTHTAQNILKEVLSDRTISEDNKSRRD